MFERFKKRYLRWKKWASWHLGDPLYKILVLFGLQKSPTFDMGPQVEKFTSDWAATHGDIREGQV